MRDCEKMNVRDLLPDYAHGALAGAERARVEAHLGECDACRAELALLRAMRAAHPVPAVATPDIARIVAALPRAAVRPAAGEVASERPGVISLDAHRARRGAGNHVLPWRQAIAAAAVVVAAVGIGVVGKRSRGPEAPATGGQPMEVTRPGATATTLA